MKSYKKTITELIFFSLPIIVGQIGQMLFGVVDIIVGGRYSSELVSALGIANSLISPLLVFGLGISFQVGPMVAQRIKNKTLTDDFFYSALRVNALLGFALTAIYIIIPLFCLDLFGFPAEVIPLIKTYSYLIAPSLLFSVIYQNHKEFLQAHEKTFFPNFCIIFFNIVNLFLNIALVFGKFGFPEMGIAGTGISTLICRGSMLVVLHIYLCRHFNFAFFKTSKTYVRDIIKEGLPVAFGITAEVFMFSVSTILAGTMGIVTSAAHNICLNIASTTFMVPLALSSAISVKVGHSYGLRDGDQLKKYMWSAFLIVFLFSLISSFTYLIFPNQLMAIATDKKDVIAFGAGLMFYVALFQVPDCLQISVQGVLRGMSITSQTMWITISCALGSIPLAYFLAFNLDLKARGLWIALACSLTIQFFLYTCLLRNKIRVFEISLREEDDQSSLT